MAEYIEREAVLVVRCGVIDIDSTEREALVDFINEIPAADVVERKRGEWIDDPRPYYGARQYVCDQCSEDEYWRIRLCCFKENFCPNCGADMRRDTND